MAVRIRLTRVGATKQPAYRLVVADSRKARDSRSIETIGHYNPRSEPVELNIDADKAKAWLDKGAQPSDTVKAILRKTGDWQQFKGLPAPAPLKTAEPKPEKESLYVAALKESGIDPSKAYVSEEAAKAAPKSKKSAAKADESAKTEEVEAAADEASETKGE